MISLQVFHCDVDEKDEIGLKHSKLRFERFL